MIKNKPSCTVSHSVQLLLHIYDVRINVQPVLTGDYGLRNICRRVIKCFLEFWLYQCLSSTFELHLVWYIRGGATCISCDITNSLEANPGPFYYIYTSVMRKLEASSVQTLRMEPEGGFMKVGGRIILKILTWQLYCFSQQKPDRG